MNPRSCLRWKSMGKIFKTVGLRWVPTGKIFTSSTTKVDSEPPNGSNEDITNPYECEQTLNVSAGTLNLSAVTSDHYSSELGIHDHNNEPSSLKFVPKVVPLADKTATSRPEMELLFHHHITKLRYSIYTVKWSSQNRSLIPAESDSLSHAHAQTTKTYYKHQDSSIKKTQVLKTKTSSYSDIKDNSSETKLQERLLERFKEDAKYEHVGQDTRSQDEDVEEYDEIVDIKVVKEDDVLGDGDVMEGEEAQEDGLDEDENDNPNRWGKYADRLMDIPKSRGIGYYLKHEINKRTINDLVNNYVFNDILLKTRLGKMDSKFDVSLCVGPSWLLRSFENQT
ncbi:hypothetical protein Tco_1501459 [Tanacetum coccineum]